MTRTQVNLMNMRESLMERITKFKKDGREKARKDRKGKRV